MVTPPASVALRALDEEDLPLLQINRPRKVRKALVLSLNHTSTACNLFFTAFGTVGTSWGGKDTTGSW